MPTLSVKLPEETRQRIQSVARSQGTTVHAVMVCAIESALAKAEYQGVLVSAALRELVISRGRTGYLALYAYDEVADLVTVLAVLHQREQDYH